MWTMRKRSAEKLSEHAGAGGYKLCFLTIKFLGTFQWEFWIRYLLILQIKDHDTYCKLLRANYKLTTNPLTGKVELTRLVTDMV